EDQTLVVSTRDTPRTTAQRAEELQEQTIIGQVVDETGKPLEGATVSAKGTIAVTTTDASGQYRITIPEGVERLTFTMLGYHEEDRPLTGASSVNVTMKASVNDLNEVVVVGYGTQRRRDLTGAVSS